MYLHTGTLVQVSSGREDEATEGVDNQLGTTSIL